MSSVDGLRGGFGPPWPGPFVDLDTPTYIRLRHPHHWGLDSQSGRFHPDIDDDLGSVHECEHETLEYGRTNRGSAVGLTPRTSLPEHQDRTASRMVCTDRRSVRIIRTCPIRRSASLMTLCRSSTVWMSHSQGGWPSNSAAMRLSRPCRLLNNSWRMQSWSPPNGSQGGRTRSPRVSGWGDLRRGSPRRGVLGRSRQASAVCRGFFRGCSTR